MAGGSVRVENRKRRAEAARRRRPPRFPDRRLQPGDLLLSNWPNFMSELVEITTWSDYAHVGVYVGNDQVVDADYYSGRVLLLSLQRSIRPTTLDAEFVDVYRHRNIGGRGRAISADARRLVGRRYDSWGAFASQIPLLRRDGPEALARLFCSELACHVYAHNGAPIIEELQCSAITPDAVAGAETTQLLGRVVGPTRD